jgi:hypothetical protein
MLRLGVLQSKLAELAQNWVLRLYPSQNNVAIRSGSVLGKLSRHPRLSVVAAKGKCTPRNGLLYNRPTGGVQSSIVINVSHDDKLSHSKNPICCQASVVKSVWATSVQKTGVNATRCKSHIKLQLDQFLSYPSHDCPARAATQGVSCLNSNVRLPRCNKDSLPGEAGGPTHVVVLAHPAISP